MPPAWYETEPEATPATVVVAVDTTDCPPWSTTDAAEEGPATVVVTVAVFVTPADGGAADDVTTVVVLDTVVAEGAATLVIAEPADEKAAVVVVDAATWATFSEEVDAACMAGLVWGTKEATPTRSSAMARPPRAPAKNPPLPIPPVISGV